MSGKKSFDVQPRKKAPPQKSARRKAKSAPKPARMPRRKTLRERREEAQQLKWIFIATLVVVALGILLYLLWRPEVRIQSVQVPETGYEAAQAAALSVIDGTYYGVFPRDSFFLYPEREVRQTMLDMYPMVSDVSVSRGGFTEISLSFEFRTSAFLWCGTPSDAGITETPCYFADEEGYLYARATELATTTDLLRVYGNLAAGSSTDAYPLRSHVEGTERIPDILRFAKALKALSIPLQSIAIRGDEADLYTDGGTRITYVIGKERDAAEHAELSLPKLNLMDGSVEYVDLRFDGKVYLKRRGE